MSQSKPGMDAKQLVIALGEVAKRLRNSAVLSDEQARREPSFRARQHAVDRADQMRADAKVVDAAHELLKRALGGPG